MPILEFRNANGEFRCCEYAVGMAELRAVINTINQAGNNTSKITNTKDKSLDDIIMAAAEAVVGVFYNQQDELDNRKIQIITAIDSNSRIKMELENLKKDKLTTDKCEALLTTITKFAEVAIATTHNNTKAANLIKEIVSQAIAAVNTYAPTTTTKKAGAAGATSTEEAILNKYKSEVKFKWLELLRNLISKEGYFIRLILLNEVLVFINFNLLGGDALYTLGFGSFKGEQVATKFFEIDELSFLDDSDCLKGTNGSYKSLGSDGSLPTISQSNFEYIHPEISKVQILLTINEALRFKEVAYGIQGVLNKTRKQYAPNATLIKNWDTLCPQEQEASKGKGKRKKNGKQEEKEPKRKVGLENTPNYLIEKYLNDVAIEIKENGTSFKAFVFFIILFVLFNWRRKEFKTTSDLYTASLKSIYAYKIYEQLEKNTFQSDSFKTIKSVFLKAVEKPQESSDAAATEIEWHPDAITNLLKIKIKKELEEWSFKPVIEESSPTERLAAVMKEIEGEIDTKKSNELINFADYYSLKILLEILEKQESDSNDEEDTDPQEPDTKDKGDTDSKGKEDADPQGNEDTDSKGKEDTGPQEPDSQGKGDTDPKEKGNTDADADGAGNGDGAPRKGLAEDSNSRSLLPTSNTASQLSRNIHREKISTLITDRAKDIQTAITSGAEWRSWLRMELLIALSDQDLKSYTDVRYSMISVHKSLDILLQEQNNFYALEMVLETYPCDPYVAGAMRHAIMDNLEKIKRFYVLQNTPNANLTRWVVVVAYSEPAKALLREMEGTLHNTCLEEENQIACLVCEVY